MRPYLKQGKVNGITVFIEKNLKDLVVMLVLLLCVVYFVRNQRKI
jgi:hypothetical protein